MRTPPVLAGAACALRPPAIAASVNVNNAVRTKARRMRPRGLNEGVTSPELPHERQSSHGNGIARRRSEVSGPRVGEDRSLVRSRFPRYGIPARFWQGGAATPAAFRSQRWQKRSETEVPPWKTGLK